MLYVTGIYALNICCSLGTPGDWHQPALRWDRVLQKDSDAMFFGGYGIETGKRIPCHEGTFAVANHIRALLDILEMGNYPYAEGMNKHFIDDGRYTREIFGKVYSMRVLPNWAAIDAFMEKEYLMEWVRFRGKEKKQPEDKSWQKRHAEVIGDFLRTLNGQTVEYILKNGTALALCYGLDRFSEDINLDSLNHGAIQEILDKYCANNGFEYRIGKYTDTVQRFFLNYGNTFHPLKIEVSFRRKFISPDHVTFVNNLSVYNIETLCKQKIQAYSSRDRIRDLYDLTFIVQNYYDTFGGETKEAIALAFESKGLDYADYLIETQADELVDSGKFTDDFLSAYDKLGLLADENPFARESGGDPDR